MGFDVIVIRTDTCIWKAIWVCRISKYTLSGKYLKYVILFEYLENTYKNVVCTDSKKFFERQ